MLKCILVSLQIIAIIDISLWSKARTKTIIQIVFGLLSILAGIYFIQHEHLEMGQVKAILQETNIWFIRGGIVLVFLFIVVQGLIYQYSFFELLARRCR